METNLKCISKREIQRLAVRMNPQFWFCTHVCDHRHKFLWNVINDSRMNNNFLLWFIFLQRTFVWSLPPPLPHFVFVFLSLLFSYLVFSSERNFWMVPGSDIQIISRVRAVNSVSFWAKALSNCDSLNCLLSP